MNEVDRHAPAEVVKVLVGTKCDEAGGAPTAVSMEEATLFASKHGALSERCSAKMDDTNSSVRQLLERVAEKIVRNGFRPAAHSTGLSASKKAKKKGGCC